MIRFSKYFPKYKYIKGLIMVYRALYLYFDHLKISIKNPDFAIFKLNGHSNKLDSLRNIHKNDKILIVANGPSLNNIKWEKYENYVILICNGFYKEVDKLKIKPKYFFIEDTEQAELRSKELNLYKGPMKLCGINNAHVLNKGFTYFNVPYRRNMINYFDDELYPQFSRDFASCVHLGSSIVYIMLQFAYHVGSKEVHIIGLDHDYGMLPKLFPPGKIKIDKNNIENVQKCHFDPNYYSIGDVIGVPFVKRQDDAFNLANKMFNDKGFKIINDTKGSKCEAFQFLD